MDEISRVDESVTLNRKIAKNPTGRHISGNG